MVFNRAGSLDQVLVPIDSSRPDFAERMWDAVEKLATFEGRTSEAVVTDLLSYDSDLLRYRIVSPRTQRGTIPLGQAIDLLSGAKQSLLSAAHSVLALRRHHPKLSRTEAVQLLEACQMGQTERGSFVVTIACPMGAIDEEEAGLFDRNVPFARRATELLTKALVELDTAIEENRINSVVDQDEPLVSANLCEALLKMRPSQDNAMLEFLPSWAPSHPISLEQRLPTSVIFSGDEFEPIEEVYRQLRPTSEELVKPWIAFVDELRGTEGEAGTREGEVVLALFDEDQVIRARANLTKEQYRIAYDAHNPSRPIWVHGQLIRGPRVSRLTNVAEIRFALAGDVNN